VKPQDFNSTRTLVVGNTGCGKSRLSKEKLKSCNRLIFLDPLREWGEECDVVFDFDELKKQVQEPTFRLAVWIEHDDQGELVDLLIRLERAREVGNCVLAIDELSWFFDARRDPSLEVEKLFRFGRRQGVHFWGISQRYVDAPIIVRSMSTHLYAFRSREEVDVDRLAKMVGSTSDASQVKTLQDGEYLLWDLRHPATPKRGTVREMGAYRDHRVDGLPGDGDCRAGRLDRVASPESDDCLIEDSDESDEG